MVNIINRNGGRGLNLALAAGVAALGLGASEANAAAYGYATQAISDFTLTATTGSFTVASGSVRSTSSATYAGGGTAADAVGTLGGTADASQSTAGPGPFTGQNDFGQVLTSGNGGRGDALISGDTATLVSEARAAGGVIAGGDSAATAVVNVAVTNGTVLQFGFDALIDLIATTDFFGENSIADLGSNFTISLFGSGGETLFSWAPNGVSNRPGEVDPFSLNQDLSAADGSSPSAINLSGSFLSPLTDALAAGNYVLSFAFDTKVRVASAQVPEPGALGLMGLGLLAMTQMRKRRKIA